MIHSAQHPVDGLVWVVVIDADRRRWWVSEDVALTVDGLEVAAEPLLAIDSVVEQVQDDGAGVVVVTIPDDVEPRAFLALVADVTAEVALVPVEAGVARWEERNTLRYGRVSDTEYRPSSREASLNVGPWAAEDTSDLCPAGASVADGTWPLAPDESQGRRPPRVYGQPGSYAYEAVTDSAGLTTAIAYEGRYKGVLTFRPLFFTERVTHTAPATPVIVVDAEDLDVDTTPWDDTDPAPLVPMSHAVWVLVSDGHVAATEVELWMQIPPQFGEFSLANKLVGQWTTATGEILHRYDIAGRPVSIAVVADLDGIRRRSTEWRAAWTAGGGVGASPSAQVGALGALVADVLSSATVPIDWTSIHAVESYLNRFRIGGYVDASITAVEWARSRTEAAGIIWRWTRAGLSAAVIDPLAAPAPVLRLEIEVLDDDVEPLGEVAALRMVRQVAAEGDEVEVRWAIASGISQTLDRRMTSIARRPGGTRQRRVDGGDLHEVWDSATAVAMAEVALRRLGGHVDATVEWSTTRSWWIRVGDLVDVVGHGEIEDGPWVVVEALHTTDPLRTLTLRRWACTEAVGAATLESTTATQVQPGGSPGGGGTWA